MKKTKNAKSLADIEVTSDFEENVKVIDQSGIKTSVIKKALQELDAQKKEKNIIKKGGAFHEENAMIDLRSLLMHGKPNFHEVKYHMDWWEKVGLLTNVLARRGLKLSNKNLMWKKAFEARNEATNPNSPFELSIRRQRSGANRKKRV